MSHEDGQIATCAVVALEYIPQCAAACVRTGGQDQRTTGRRQRPLLIYACVSLASGLLFSVWAAIYGYGVRR